MSGRGKYRGSRPRNNYQNFPSVAKEGTASLAADSPVLAMFKNAALKLSERQDRHERLVKLSRDTTIESKRVIFLLHSAVTKEATGKAVIEAKERLQKLVEGPIKSIGLELENSPLHLHARAVTAGFQEFIEAKTFCSLMENKTIVTYPEIQKEFQYDVKEEDGENTRKVVTFLPHMDYMLGLADLTGELMRRAINSIASGNRQESYHACQVVRHLYSGSLGLYGIGKELSRKTTVMRTNVSKVEGAIYAMHVRGREAPSTLDTAAATWDAHDHHSDDEGFF
ncbi:translin-associated protein X [Bicyclus anynana]|uniref:Translin-associated protein X n=1 Tax=Bicyclus anynana TaxID=110368 RepID=A0A6J1P7Y6_BICAN|nr:translin-associated protein X [Bicyclus anynana]